MKLYTLVTAVAVTTLLTAAVVAPSSAAHATTEVSPAASTSDAGFSVQGPDGAIRSITPDAVNTTSLSGLSATISMKSTDQIVLSADARTLLLQDENGGVLLNSANPTLENGGDMVPAKFVVEGDHLIVTPVEHTPNLARADCPSAFWGELIFNIGMAGVCAMLGIATAGPGGVACTMAVIGANLGIDWDAPC
ncbi:hypothetical protein [Plantibacter sp. RU18]|uniref:hypothetical protein n=1 Tax=Plantibacter sp. RU18 TaxID=3158143 RepID=UPI003D362EF6